MKFLNRHVLSILALAILCCTMLPYWDTCGFGLIDFDDYAYVGRDAFVVNGFSWQAFLHSFTYLEQAIWMPLTWMSYMLDFSLFHGDPGAMHVHSFLIHAFNAVLLFIFLLSLFGGMERNGHDGVLSRKSILAIAVATLLWSVHPLRVESVTWVAARKDVLSLFWELLAMICWVRFRTRRLQSFYWLSLLFFVVGSLAKPSVMTFPFLMFLVDWLLLDLVSPQKLFAIFSSKGDAKSQQQGLVLALPYFIPVAYAVFLGIFAGYAQSAGQAMENMRGVPLWWKLLNAAVSYGIYIWNTICPIKLAPECIARWPGMPRFLLPGLAIAAGVGYWMLPRIIKRLNNHEKSNEAESTPAYFLTGILWFTLALVPFLGIAGFGYHAFADRFTYIPSIGLAIAIAGYLVNASGKILSVSILPVLLLVPLTRAQSNYWRDDEAIYRRTLEVDGDNVEAYVGLGMYYFEFRHEKLDLAIESFKKAYETNPDGAGKIGPLYIIALCETNRIEEASQVLRWYSDWKDRYLGNNTSNNPFGAKSPFLYRVAKVVWYASQNNMMDDAIAELRDMELTMGKNVNYLYAKGLVEWKRGNHESAREIWRYMRESGIGENYILYRFTQNL